MPPVHLSVGGSCSAAQTTKPHFLGRKEQELGEAWGTADTQGQGSPASSKQGRCVDPQEGGLPPSVPFLSTRPPSQGPWHPSFSARRPSARSWSRAGVASPWPTLLPLAGSEFRKGKCLPCDGAVANVQTQPLTWTYRKSLAQCQTGQGGWGGAASPACPCVVAHQGALEGGRDDSGLLKRE